MNNLIKIVSAIFVLCFFTSRAGAEDWCFTANYPYIQTKSTGTWYYLPDPPPYAYNYSTGEWVPNPLGGRTFDVDDILNSYPATLYMFVAGSDTPISIELNSSVAEEGTLVIAGVTRTIKVALAHDVAVARCQLYGSWTEANSDSRSFSIVLSFDSLTSGSFTLLGNLGGDSDSISPRYGVFSVATE